MPWPFAATFNMTIGLAYFAIAWIIMSGLSKTGQMRTNRLGLATGLIFLTCAVHHSSHALHMLAPSLGIGDAHGLAMRQGWDWPMVAWDALGAAVALYYFSLRGAYGSVLRGAQLFEDMKVRQAQAVEINDNIVQGLTVAKAAMESGRSEHSRQAVEDTLREARKIITDLLGEEETRLGPGDLRRRTAATVAPQAPGTG